MGKNSYLPFEATIFAKREGGGMEEVSVADGMREFNDAVDEMMVSIISFYLSGFFLFFSFLFFSFLFFSFLFFSFLFFFSFLSFIQFQQETGTEDCDLSFYDELINYLPDLAHDDPVAWNYCLVKAQHMEVYLSTYI